MLLSEFFTIHRSCRQGDPLSLYLFILCIEPLAMAIKNNNIIKGITFGDIKLKIGQYADRSRCLYSTYDNHASAVKFPDHVHNYITTETKYGAILGPFDEYPFPCHVSPFLTREKPNSANRRVILDLSFPVGQSVNDGVAKDKYLNTYFHLNYPSVDSIVNSLKSMGPDAMIYKIDISRAFRHIRIDPGDLDLLGLQHQQLFIDRTLPFGFRHGSVFFQCCIDAVRFIMRDTFKFPYLYNYIDDLVYSKSKVTKNQLQSLLGSLLYVTKCIKPARFFLNRMLQLLRDSTSKSHINLNRFFHRDLNWFNTFLWRYNGITFYNHQKPHHTVHLDACLTGFGGWLQTWSMSCPFLWATKIIQKIWGHHWQDKIIEIKCDNMAVVDVLRTRKARDGILATCARNIWLLTSLFNIQLLVNHIPGIHNETADLLSRWQGTDKQFHLLSTLVPNYEWMPVHLDHTQLNANI